MINAKKIYNEILNDERIKAFVSDDQIFDSYPNNIETFPCIIYLDNNQRDLEFADNKPTATGCNVEIHIFTKTLEGFPTTSEIGIVLCDIMKEKYFSCPYNAEVSDVQKDVKHRIMNFTKEFLC